MKPLSRPMFRNGGPIKEGIMTGMKDRPGYKKGSLIGGIISKIPGGQTLIDQGRGIIPRVFNKLKPTPVPKFRQTGLDKPIGFRGPMSERATRIPFMERAGMFTRQNPFFVGATLPFGVSAGLNVGKGIYDVGPGIVKNVALQATDLAVPDFIFDQDKFLENKKIAELNKNIKEKKKSTLKPKEKITTTTPTIDRDAEIEANRKRYYKLMGIDKMKKGAAYDSLIDTSKIIQEEGGDLKGAIKSGNLQSRIINAISKNLDKSADLKKQIDAAILKGEITKDINKEKDFLTKELTRKKIELADKQLLGGSLNETLTALETKQGIVPEGPALATIALEKGIDIPSGHTFNTKEVNTFLKDNPTLNVVDFVNDQNTKLQAAGKGSLDPGNYVVGKNIVVVGDDGTVIDVIT
tara:strand:+ start:237 stop:1460 length:1224 start_codon:yes stop_codon:yes gene_type:complete